MALDGRRYRRRKKEVVFADGYFIDHAADVNPTFDKSEETFHIYGADSPQHDVQHNSTQLMIELMDKFENNALLDLLTKQNPDNVPAVKQYRIDDLGTATIWANVKDAGSTKYIKSWIVSGWTPGMPLPSGGANEKARMQLTGKGDLARQFQNAWITMKKVASGASVALGLTPVAVPNESNIFAVAVKAIRQDTPAGVFETEDVPVTPAMVTATGNVVFAEINALASIPFISHAAVYVLQTGVGIYPANKPDKLRQ